MPLTNYILYTIIGCGLATWLSRILPLVILKNMTLSKKVIEFLSFVPIAIMSSLWFESLFIQKVYLFNILAICQVLIGLT